MDGRKTMVATFLCLATFAGVAEIRMFTWPVYLHSFLRSNHLSDRFLTQFFRGVCEHNHRLIDRPTIGNWQIHQLSGILTSVVAFPFLKDAPKWEEEYALAGLKEEFGKQVYKIIDELICRKPMKK